MINVKDFELGRLSWMILLGPVCPHESLKAENLAWLGSDGDVIIKEEYRDATLLAMKIEKGNQEPRNVDSCWKIEKT